MKQRQLFQCSYAKCKGEVLYCAKGYKLGRSASYNALQRGAPLVIDICRKCKDFSYMGEALKKEDRGFK